MMNRAAPCLPQRLSVPAVSRAGAEHPGRHAERCEENLNDYSWEFWEKIGRLTIFFPLEKLITALCLFFVLFCLRQGHSM